ncbi:MAG TPA: NADH-quinone oxidoreductase subunit NuoH [Pirellulaceae bacterium]|jgi:NADH-quinone oxidoreductase subunit H|nr:NADH-quinone oxidoreductase subunit NuoH [Pirellulaceae bacterium]
MSLSDLIVTILVISVTLGGTLGICSYLIWLERKLSAAMQDRLGPNRVGPAGLFQPIADGLKFILKEEFTPKYVDKFLFTLAPCVSVFTTLLAFAVVPFGPMERTFEWFRFVVAPGVDIGLVFVFAVTSLAVYGIILGGWASNNKYSVLGALRSSAQVISYELPLGMSVLGIALLSGTLNLEQIAMKQGAVGILGWNVWVQPLACLIFFTAALAESNRLPFDLPECEQELVGGYHTEYSAMKFAMFFLAEYAHVITVSFLTSILFFGAWYFPGISTPTSDYPLAWVVGLAVLFFKVLCCIVFIMLLRWTIPRFRFDQLMNLAWKGLIPLALLNVVCVMLTLHFDQSRWWLALTSIGLFLGAGALSLTLQRSPRPTSSVALRRAA